MQAYLNQEFPLGCADLRLHPVLVAEDPAEVQSEGAKTEVRATGPLTAWRFALAMLP